MRWGLDNGGGDCPKARGDAGAFEDSSVLVFDGGLVFVKVGSTSVVAKLSQR